jgi:DtxR family transcriptional regulator, Mn-dependent transcriptional regulator
MSTTRLDRLAAGRSGRVVHVAFHDPLLMARLAHFGLVPGARVEVEQAWPATVVRVGETTIALEPAVAAYIHVEPGLDAGPRP